MGFPASLFKISQSQCHTAVSLFFSFFLYSSIYFFIFNFSLFYFYPGCFILSLLERVTPREWWNRLKKNEFKKIRWNCVRVKKRKCNRNWKSDRTRLPTLHFIAAVYSNFLSSSLHLFTLLHLLLCFPSYLLVLSCFHKIPNHHI